MESAIILREHGGPETLQSASIDVAGPGPGLLRIRQTAIGVNFHDIYVRTGLYRTLELPGIPGLEAAGYVESVGEGISGFVPGDRVAYVSPGYGGYASARLLRAEDAIRLPDALDDIAAAGSLMKALTVCMLVRRVHLVLPGQAILVHAAAGGVGQMLCRWASHLGATVIGTVGSEAKAAIARQSGAAHTILYRAENIASRVANITGGAGVAAAYDSIGADTFSASLDALGYEGRLVSFGQASGPVAPFPPSALAVRSLSVSRPIIFHYLRTREMRDELAAETFAAFGDGIIRPARALRFPLSQAAEAHRLLERGESPGALVLQPDAHA